MCYSSIYLRQFYLYNRGYNAYYEYYMSIIFILDVVTLSEGMRISVSTFHADLLNIETEKLQPMLYNVSV